MASYKHRHSHLKHPQHKYTESHRSLSSYSFQPTHIQAAHPAHRKSLIIPQHYTIVTAQGDHTDSDLRTDPNMRSGRDKIMTSSAVQRPSGDADQEVYSGWMTKFCVEPPNDINTCCLGFWLPCVLFTKTHHRLGSVGRGEDALEGWTPTMGCTLPCWAYCVLTGVCRSSGCLTGCQSTRIRGTYGIEGSMFKDICRGYWCPQCAQMQNDREVRAREGVDEMKYNPKYLASIQDGIVDTQPPPQPPMSYTPTQRNSDEMPQLTEAISRAKKLQRPSPFVEAQVEVPSLEVYTPQPPEVRVAETSAKLEQHQQGWTKSKGGISDDGKHHQHSKDKHQERKVYAKGRLHSGAQATVSDVEASRNSDKITDIRGSSAKENTCDIRKKSDHQRLTHRHPLVRCVSSETERKNKSRSKTKGHAVVDCTIIEVENENLAPENTATDCTSTPTRSATIDEQRRLTDCSGVTASDTQELSYVHDFTDCPVDKAVLNYFESQEKKLQQHSLTDDLRGSLATIAKRRAEQHRLSQDHRDSSSTIEEDRANQHTLTQDSRASTFAGEEGRGKPHSLTQDSRASTFTPKKGKEKQHSLTDDSRGSSTTVVPSYSLFPQHTSASCPGSSESSSSKSAGRHDRSSTIDSSKTKNSNGLKEHRLDSCLTVVPSSTRDHRSGGSDDGQEHRLSKCLPAPSAFENQPDAEHVHDENCLTGGLHHRCALNFEIAAAKDSGNDNNVPSRNGADPLTSDDTNQGKEGSRQKQRRFKGIRKTTDTKTGSASHDDKSGRSAEKSAQSDHSQVSSSQAGKKENAHDSQGNASNDVIGFPYSDIQGKTKIIVSHTTQGEQGGQRVEIVGEEQKDQDDTTSGFWSKIKGKGKAPA